jgi:hypothetical protein
MTESRLPPLAVILGIAGLLPFLACGVLAVGTDTLALHVGALPLISYGAVILAFLGGVHWGFVIEGVEEPAENRRLVLGVVPSLIGWAATCLAVLAYPTPALVLLVAGFIGTAVVETKATRRELVPRAYMIMRWALTVLVVVILTTVIFIRLIGGHLAF